LCGGIGTGDDGTELAGAVVLGVSPGATPFFAQNDRMSTNLSLLGVMVSSCLPFAFLATWLAPEDWARLFGMV
jgi:hypothetical protein